MSNETISLPHELRRQFQALERRLWRIDAAVAICGAAGALVLSCALEFISDRLWDTPFWLRAFFSALGLGLLLYFLYGYGRRWIWGIQRIGGIRGFEALAGLVQKRYRRLGDRLLGIVELADEGRRPPNVSPALCAAAIGQVAAEAARIDFREAASPKKSYRYARFLALLLAVAAIPCVFAPEASLNALKRWIWPGSRVARYTFVSLGDLPARKVVAHGEPFEIACSVSSSSVWHPSWASCRFEDQPILETPVVAGNILFRIPGQTQNGFLTLRAGDVTKRILIEPVYRPELKQLVAHIDLPGYLGYPPVTEKIDGGSFALLRGSRVFFEGKTSRSLEDAEMELTSEASGGSKPALQTARLDIEKNSFHSASLALEGFSQCLLRWKDIFGLDAPAPAVFKLQTKEDAPPEIECTGVAEAIAILEEEVLNIPLSAQDDYGVREMGVTWEVAARASDKSPARTETRTVRQGGPQVRTLKGSFDFSPLLLHIPADSTVTLRAVATDYFPGRAPSESAPCQIYVLGKEAHARLIEEQLEKLAGELEELTRKQEALLESGKQIREQKPEKLAAEESAQKLGEQASDQTENGEQLTGIAQEVASTLREALRNPALSEKLLHDWAKQAEAMRGIAQKEMPEAAHSLDSSGREQAGRAADLTKALAEEQKILDSLRGLQKSSDKALDGLTAANIALRLRKIAGAERQISTTFQSILPDTVGMRPGEMPSEKRQLVEQMQAGEETSRAESNELQDEIARFFDRTRLTRYGEVSRDMGEGKIDENLERLAQLVSQNTSVAAIESAGEWAGRFNQWADRLEQSDESKTASGAGAASEEQLEAMLELVRLRQQQASLRDQTVALDRQDQPHSDTASPRALGTTQHGLEEAVQKLQAQPGFPVPASQLEPVRQAMSDAGGLLSKSITGDATVGAETDAINVLDYLMDGGPGGGGSDGASLAMLREMMGMGAAAGKAGTGSMAGGTTERPNERVEGSRVGAASGPRAVTTTGGKEIQTVPVEFRDALESYYGAIENAR